MCNFALAATLQVAVYDSFAILRPAQSTGQAERWERPGWCAKHSLQMTQNHKNGRSWWSHRLADGTWCKGK
jgi:hypothetical protein